MYVDLDFLFLARQVNRCEEREMMVPSFSHLNLPMRNGHRNEKVRTVEEGEKQTNPTNPPSVFSRRTPLFLHADYPSPLSKF